MIKIIKKIVGNHQKFDKNLVKMSKKCINLTKIARNYWNIGVNRSNIWKKNVENPRKLGKHRLKLSKIS